MLKSIFWKIKKFFQTLYACLVLVKSILQMVIKPTDVSPIFKVKAFINSKSVKHCLGKIFSDPGFQVILKERYLPEHSKAYLESLPAGTLGSEYLKFIVNPIIQDPKDFPKIDTPGADSDFLYFRMRARQTHDLHHTVLGFPATPVGEMAISAFYLAQTDSPLNAMLIVVGFLVTTFKVPHRYHEFFEALILGWNTGKKADFFLGIKWEEMWELPMSEVRRRVGVPPAYDFEFKEEKELVYA